MSISKSSKLMTHTFFSIISLYFFIAELLFFKYTLKGIWTSRLLLIIWIAFSILLIFKYWGKKIAKLYLLFLFLCSILLISFIGILGSSILYSIPNLDFKKKFDLGGYVVYVRESFFVGQYSILYKNNLLFKERISKRISKGNNLNNFSEAKIISVENNKIFVLYKNEVSELIIEYSK